MINHCEKCHKELTDSEAYEYRGVYACDEHFDLVCASRDRERNEIIREEDAKLKPLKGMDLDPRSPVGRANREILAPHIEIASKESGRMKRYERRNK
jgi:hypothetical protein